METEEAHPDLTTGQNTGNSQLILCVCGKQSFGLGPTEVTVEYQCSYTQMPNKEAHF